MAGHYSIFNSLSSLFVVIILLAMLSLWLICRKLNNVQVPVILPGKEERHGSSAPSSILEIQVRIPTRVIFCDETVVKNRSPSEFAQTPAVGLGEGTLGHLFKVVLDNGWIATIRRLREDTARSPELDRWINYFGRIRDTLLVPILFGFWFGKEAFIVYEYICLGSLEELLHGREGIHFTALSWDIRRNIALYAAMAVARIHARTAGQGEGKGLVCGVIKASNVLIRTDFTACLSGYETAYLASPTKIIKRNPGRVAPEAQKSGVFTQESDVYSFGILLLELVTGKKPVVSTKDGREVKLVDYVMFKREEEGLKDLYDKRVVGVGVGMDQMLGIAGLCLVKNPTERPNMEGVVTMIQQLE